MAESRIDPGLLAPASGVPGRERDPVRSKWLTSDRNTLRRSLLGWLASAGAAGLDEDGIVALFTSALRDFRERQASPRGHRPGADGESEGVA